MFSVLVAGADSAESAVTVFDRLPPASTSACVTVCEQPYDPGLRELKLRVRVARRPRRARGGAALGSETVIPVSVTLPVFVTVKRVGHDLAGDADRDRRRRLDDVDRRALRDRDVQRARRRRRLGRVDCHRVREVPARVHLGLRHGAAAAVHPRLGELQLRVCVGVAGRKARRRRALRVGDRDAGERDVARVRDRERVRHHLARRGHRDGRRGLRHVDRGDCDDGMFSVLVAGADSSESAVTVLERLPPASTSRLRHRVRAAVDPRLGELQLRVGVRVTARTASAPRALRVGDGDPCERDVARVRDRERVRHHLAGRGDRRRRRGLTTAIEGALRRPGCSSCSVSGARLRRVRRHRVREVPARVDLRLRHRVRAAVDPRLGQLQLRVSVRVAARTASAPRRTSGRRP